MPVFLKSTQPAALPTTPVLGSWRDGRFDFTSPEARQTWHRSAFAQGIDPETWHLGAKVDDKTHQVIAAGLAGPVPPFISVPMASRASATGKPWSAPPCVTSGRAPSAANP